MVGAHMLMCALSILELECCHLGIDRNKTRHELHEHQCTPAFVIPVTQNCMKGRPSNHSTFPAAASDKHMNLASPSYEWKVDLSLHAPMPQCLKRIGQERPCHGLIIHYICTKIKSCQAGHRSCLRQQATHLQQCFDINKVCRSVML
jgi:hypothetical protein